MEIELRKLNEAVVIDAAQYLELQNHQGQSRVLVSKVNINDTPFKSLRLKSEDEEGAPLYSNRPLDA